MEFSDDDDGGNDGSGGDNHTERQTDRQSNGENWQHDVMESS
jgi:hypothetical protein